MIQFVVAPSEAVQTSGSQMLPTMTTNLLELLIPLFTSPGGLELRWEECYGAIGEVAKPFFTASELLLF